MENKYVVDAREYELLKNISPYINEDRKNRNDEPMIIDEYDRIIVGVVTKKDVRDIMNKAHDDKTISNASLEIITEKMSVMDWVEIGTVALSEVMDSMESSGIEFEDLDNLSEGGE